MSASKPRRILSIDGGGLRGIVPAMVIDKIESVKGKPISELFDVVVGTSTGGIIACCLKYGYSGKDIVNMFKTYGYTIFPRTPMTPIKGLFFAKYSSSGLRELLTKYLADAKLSDPGEIEIIVPAYDLDRRCPIIFRSTRAAHNRRYDFCLDDIAMATSAAPTYFEPAYIYSIDGSGYKCIDGGVYANNPAMVGYVAEVSRLKNRDDFLVVSLGTGRAWTPAKLGGWGLSSWIRPLLDVISDGIGDTVSYELGQLLPRGRYYRLQATMNHKLDDISVLDRSVEYVDSIVKSHEFEMVCEAL